MVKYSICCFFSPHEYTSTDAEEGAVVLNPLHRRHMEILSFDPNLKHFSCTPLSLSYFSVNK